MGAIFLAIGVGLATGYAMRRRPRWIAGADRLSGLAVLALLFLLGVGVGRDPIVLANLGRLGLLSLGFSLSAMAGSILAVVLLVRTRDAE